MTSWTPEQLKAINDNGHNILVSAGAGSGKTAVLTERVINKLQSGTKINELLILTFTNAAAAEMKERIRKKILSHNELKDNLKYIDSSYITTFDSYCLSLVKKYYYVKNLSKNINIVDNSLVVALKNKLLDEIFYEKYQKKDDNFLKMINDFCLKNDTDLKEEIINIYDKISLKRDKTKYLNNYLDTFYADEKISDLVEKYIVLIKNEQSYIELQLELISEIDKSGYYDKLSKSLDKLLKCKKYDEFKETIDNLVIPRRGKDTEEISDYKSEIDNSVKKIKEYLRFKNENHIIETYKSTKDYLKVIIEIIQQLDDDITTTKKSLNMYEFVDIELMAIQILEENIDICTDIKNGFKEIMIDEYQDTSDLQECFIKLIENDNVYMVGDIKQSIYGFRNANPDIFKNKYYNYSNNINGQKIDLVNNFRSRHEVLYPINEMFSKIMDMKFGGADYNNGHAMKASNLLYDNNPTKEKMELLSYISQKDEYTADEKEAFIIANDIKNKISNNYLILDNGCYRPAMYKDFCIIMDRGSAFDTYKKIFEYCQIPLDIKEDRKLNSEIIIRLITNIIGLILKIKINLIDNEFKYYYISISRSFLFNKSDDEILETILNNDYYEDSIFKIAQKISESIDEKSNYQLVNQIIYDYNIYQKLVCIGEVSANYVKLDNILNLAKNLDAAGKKHNELFEHLKEVNDSDIKITYKDPLQSSNNVKIMNIHKSKGLEFPICYFSGFTKEFNTMDIKERFIYSDNYGIITPYYENGIGTIFVKDIVRNSYNINNISERIRLLYVALTRAKEKIIIVCPNLENNNYILSDNVKIHYNSFYSVINSISNVLQKYTIPIDLNNILITKKYLSLANKNLSIKRSKEKIIFKEINITEEESKKNKASKVAYNIMTKEELESMKYGTKFHELLECSDFNNNDDIVIKSIIEKLNIKKDDKIYKEHEFYFEKDNEYYHGVIDLLIIKDRVIIVDYKSKDIFDKEYIKQLQVYCDYIKCKLNVECEAYLYSIILDEIKKVEF